MKKFITILITSFLIPLIINASTIHFVDNNRELFIRGNKNIGFYFSNPDSLMDIIRNEGYLDVNYTITNDTLFVSTGKQFLLQQIVFDNDDTVTVDPPVPFIQKSVSKTISTYLYQERETGNLFADYKITDVQMSGNMITLFLQKNEGPKIKLNDIRFKGLTRTDQNAIRKYFLIDSNVVITPLLLNNIENRLKRSLSYYILLP